MWIYLECERGRAQAAVCGKVKLMHETNFRDSTFEFNHYLSLYLPECKQHNAVLMLKRCIYNVYDIKKILIRIKPALF